MMNEQQLEDLCIAWFQETGWQFVHGPDVAPDGTNPERADYRQVILRDRLLAALARINPHIPAAALEQAAHIVQTISDPQAVVRNRSFHRLLLSGVAVEFSLGDEKKADLVHLIDFANPQHNEFLVINQFTVTGTKQPRRPDLVAFINGLPLAVIELKNPANEQTDVWDAFNQLQTYKDEISDLFNSNEALVVSDGWTARVGSLTANTERMLPWRTIASEDDRPRLQMELETVVRGFFKPELFLDYLRHFVLFEQDGDQIIKKVAGQQQLLSDSQILAEASSSLGLAADQRAVKSRCVLLVEGQEDVRFVTKINQWMYEEKLVEATFAEKGLFILPVGGCGSLLAWLNFDLFSKLNEPWFILIDSDKGTDEAKQSQRHLHRIRAKYPGMQAHIHATFKREIENYLVFKEGKKTHVFAPYEDVKQHMYDLMQQRHQSWSKDKTASKLMEQMDLADLQDYYEKDGQKHRELVEYFLQIDHFIDGLA